MLFQRVPRMFPYFSLIVPLIFLLISPLFPLFSLIFPLIFPLISPSTYLLIFHLIFPLMFSLLSPLMFPYCPLFSVILYLPLFLFDFSGQPILRAPFPAKAWAVGFGVLHRCCDGLRSGSSFAGAVWTCVSS